MGVGGGEGRGGEWRPANPAGLARAHPTLAQTCVNTLHNMVPHHLTVPRRRGVTAFVWHDASQSLITGYQSELAVLQLARDDTARAAQTSHDHPLSAVAYFPEYNLVVSGDTGGTIVAWDLSTGAKMLSFVEAHTAAITCLEADHRATRLLSAVRL